VTSGRLGSLAALSLAVVIGACSSSSPTASPSTSGPARSPSATAGEGSARPTRAPTTPGESRQPTEPTPTDGVPSTPAVTASPSAEAPLPTCAYKDKPAVGDPDTDWATMVLDTIYRLPADFVPKKLVSTSRAGLQKGYEIIPDVVDDLRAMHEASIEDDAEIAIRWAYRSYAEQQHVFAYWTQLSGEEAALKLSARPGHSEHQMGTAIDFRSEDSLKAPWDYDDWATTDAGEWMDSHAWRFGFVLSYPKGKEDVTCYGYEPWHYRYVGRDHAQQIHASGLTPREFLWSLAHSG
jgi:D-alanyl-D-alanine carboxypeptidase